MISVSNYTFRDTLALLLVLFIVAFHAAPKHLLYTLLRLNRCIKLSIKRDVFENTPAEKSLVRIAKTFQTSKLTGHHDRWSYEKSFRKYADSIVYVFEAWIEYNISSELDTLFIFTGREKCSNKWLRLKVCFFDIEYLEVVWLDAKDWSSKVTSDGTNMRLFLLYNDSCKRLRDTNVKWNEKPCDCLTIRLRTAIELLITVTIPCGCRYISFSRERQWGR